MHIFSQIVAVLQSQIKINMKSVCLMSALILTFTYHPLMKSSSQFHWQYLQMKLGFIHCSLAD